MEGLFLFLFWAIVIGLSIASKAQERRKAEQRALERESRKSSQPPNEAARRKVYGGAEPRTATPRSSQSAGQTPATSNREARPAPKPVEQQVLERFFGVDMDDEEGGVPQVAERTREMVERLRGRAPQAAEPTPPPVPRSSQEDIALRERKLRDRAEKAKRANEAARRRAMAAQQSRPRGRVSTGRRLFSTAPSVRDAIIMNAVLNPPKAFQEEERTVF